MIYFISPPLWYSVLIKLNQNTKCNVISVFWIVHNGLHLIGVKTAIRFIYRPKLRHWIQGNLALVQTKSNEHNNCSMKNQTNQWKLHININKIEWNEKINKKISSVSFFNTLFLLNFHRFFFILMYFPLENKSFELFTKFDKNCFLFSWICVQNVTKKEHIGVLCWNYIYISLM